MISFLLITPLKALSPNTVIQCDAENEPMNLKVKISNGGSSKAMRR